MTRSPSQEARGQAVGEQGQSIEWQRVRLEKEATEVRAEEGWWSQPQIWILTRSKLWHPSHFQMIKV